VTFTTTLSDGTVLTATSNYGPEHAARARDLGYRGSDREVVDAMNRDHDATHQHVARMLGLEDSPTLWAVAHDEPINPELADYEERVVFHFQRMRNGYWGQTFVPFGEKT
jgi:hypothetical protein